MATKNEVAIDITGKDKASPAIKSVTGGIQNIGKIAMGAAGVVGVAMGLMVKSAITFETKMREVNTMVGLGQEAFIEFGKKVQEVSKEVGIASDELGSAMYQIISAGVSSADSINVLDVAAKAAVGGVTDVTTAADGLTTILNAFKIPASEVQRVADVMFTTVKGGKTTFQELSQSIFNVAPIAAAAGINFEEVAAAIATITKQGTPTSVVTTQLRQAFIAILKPTKEMEDALKATGYESGELLLKEKGLADGAEILREAAGGSLDMLNRMFGSAEAGSAILGITGDNATMFAQDIANAMNSAGAATAAYDEVTQGAGHQVQVLTNEIKIIGQQIGAELLPILKDFLEEVAKVTSGIADWISKNPELTKMIGIIGALTFGFLAFAGAALLASTAIKSTFIPMLAKMVGFIYSTVIPALAKKLALLLSILAAMGPSGWVMLGVATLAIGGMAVLTKKLIDDLSKPQKSMDLGGFVPGAPGTPVPIMARAGEYFGGYPARGGGGDVHIHVGAFMGRPEDARKFADMISEEQRKNNRRTVGRSV